MQRGNVSRREFIAAGGAAAAGWALANRTAAGRTMGRRPPLRVALVGTGIRGTSMWGRDIAQKYGDVVQFVGLSDINPGRLAYAKRYIGADCPTYVDFDRMMAEQKPDLLMVTTMDSTHDEFIIKGLEAGSNVLTEKPLTTDEHKCQRILEAQRRTGRDVLVTFNYRYSPQRAVMKELLMEERVGRVTSVDFHWYLDTDHGASYFRRWHGQRECSGTLLVHKATHHFDLLNWWLDSEPETVYAQGDLEFYGINHEFRHTRCRGCPHASRCAFYWDITQDQRLMDLYVLNEEHDGYLRDGCLWREDVNIYDKMGVQARYANGVTASYSLTTYSPYEGYRIAFNGTKGRIETWVKERQPWEAEAYDEIRVTDNFGETELIRIDHAGGGHAGGDDLLRDRIFRDPTAPDPLQQSAGLRDGAMSILLGIAARKSIESGRPVEVASLTDLQPRAVRPRG